MALRIIGGRARGRRLRPPPGRGVRPTGDRVREALFNIWGQSLEGLRLLDVCGGSGAISIEALSRGAAGVVCLEREPALCRHIRGEAERAGLAEGLDVRQEEARAGIRRLRRAGGPAFDLAFVDPPWGEAGLRREIVRLLFEAPPVCRRAAVECPRGGELEAPPGAVRLRCERYGGTALVFFEAAEGPRGPLRGEAPGARGGGMRRSGGKTCGKSARNTKGTGPDGRKFCINC